jgi:hypothetical protein
MFLKAILLQGGRLVLVPLSGKYGTLDEIYFKNKGNKSSGGKHCNETND